MIITTALLTLACLIGAACYQSARSYAQPLDHRAAQSHSNGLESPDPYYPSGPGPTIDSRGHSVPLRGNL